MFHVEHSWPGMNWTAPSWCLDAERLDLPVEVASLYANGLGGPGDIPVVLPELVKDEEKGTPLGKEYSSGDSLMSLEEIKLLLEEYNLMVGEELELEGEVLR